MKLLGPAMLVAASAALSACGMFSGTEDDTARNSVRGFGSITPAALQESGWTITTDLESAPPGEVVARHAPNGFCAYARGDGTFYTAPCP